MFLSFYLDGWSVPRRTLGNARFWRCWQRADGPTRVTDQPQCWDRTYREKPPYPMLAAGLWSRHISIGRIWPWVNEACDGWKQSAFPVTLEQHRVNNIYCVLGLLRSQQCKRQPRELRLDSRNVLCERARFVGAKHVQTTTCSARCWHHRWSTFHRLDFQGRRRRRALRQHPPDLPLEYELRPQNGTGKWNIKPCRRFCQIFRESTKFQVQTR